MSRLALATNVILLNSSVRSFVLPFEDGRNWTRKSCSVLYLSLNCRTHLWEAMRRDVTFRSLEFQTYNGLSLLHSLGVVRELSQSSHEQADWREHRLMSWTERANEGITQLIQLESLPYLQLCQRSRCHSNDMSTLERIGGISPLARSPKSHFG